MGQHENRIHLFLWELGIDSLHRLYEGIEFLQIGRGMSAYTTG
nr:hypothetical protein [uncultured Undibacterium sp.]